MSNIISVSRLTHAIKNTLEINFSEVAVEGELSNYKEHSSGHRYFTLKDANSQIACTMWKACKLNFTPKDGIKVVITGSITVFPPRGNYQIDVQSMLPAGKGDLYLAYEALKQKLDEKGYFLQEHKKALPKLPFSIGISTSPTGAAIQDMTTTIRRRFPACTIYFRPTLVQGEGSSEDIVQAIADLQNTNSEVIIIGRGGGSIEDLWAYNMEIVANAIFDCSVPIISAVGHETDFTIADFVADRRVATPTAAAELVTPIMLDDLQFELDNNSIYLTKLIKNYISRRKDKLGVSFGRHLNKIALDTLQMHNQTLDTFDILMNNKIKQKIEIMKATLDSRFSIIKSLHPMAPLSRGFAALRVKGKILKSGDLVDKFQKIEIIRNSDTLIAKIEKILPSDIFMVNSNEKK